MKTLTFEELIEKSYLSDVDVDIPGVGKITMRQISAAQAHEITATLGALQGDDLEDYISQKAADFVKGSTATDEEVDLLRNHHSANAISAIFQAGLASAPGPVSADLEQAEKN